MLAIELIKVLLLLFAFFAGVFGIMMSFDSDLWGKRGDTLLILVAIALIIIFHI